MTVEPAAGGEVGGDAGGQQREADGEGAYDPVEFHAALEHEPVEQGQDKDEHRCFGEEGGAAVGGDRDQIEERGGFFWRSSASGVEPARVGWMAGEKTAGTFAAVRYS